MYRVKNINNRPTDDLTNVIAGTWIKLVKYVEKNAYVCMG